MREKCPFWGVFLVRTSQFSKLSSMISMSKVPTISANNVSWKTAHINNKEVLITFYQGKGGPNSIIDIYE